MVKKTFCLVLAALVLGGCTSIPHVEKVRTVSIGTYDDVTKRVYDVAIDKDYLENAQEFKYAVNSFVMMQGGTSYDLEKYDSNRYYITIPGEQPVENLPKVKHFHVGRTWIAILAPIVGAILGTAIIITASTYK